MKKNVSVAVDGPSGAGKSTLSRAVAGDLGFLYVDTGAIYRTIGYYVMTAGLDPHGEAAIVEVLPRLEIGLRHGEDGEQRMDLNGRDVSREIRLPEVSMYASAVSAHPGVRAYLLEMQRKLARENSVLMDGRDIGTVVLPDADVKVFLTASDEVRARRRCRELEARGTPEPFEKVLEDIRKRDYDDTHRAAAPLRRAEDAVELDTTDMSFEESRRALLRLIREKAGV